MKKIKPQLVILNANQIVTCTETRQEGFKVFSEQTIVIQNSLIIDICSIYHATQKYIIDDSNSIDASGKVVAPGFIDSHTHLVFYGTRVEEYVAKLHGDVEANLKKIKLRTGPNRTIELTRDTSELELFEQSKKRILSMLKHGTTTVESKSGYGLTTDSEIKILKIGRRLQEETPLDVYNTFLGAHGIPDGMTKEKYLDIIINEMIPAVSEQNLAEFCDVWCDNGYFTANESRLILEAGLKVGMLPKIHADAYSNIGGSKLAAEMKMVSIDHMNYTPEHVLKDLKNAGVVGVLMPALDFAVNHKQPFQARKILDSGMDIALATDLCPACYTPSMPFVINLACRLYQLSVEEAIGAATIGGAKALNLHDRGTIEVGKLADLQIWDVPNYMHIAYELGVNVVDTVVKSGEVVVRKGSLVKVNIEV
ncbi:imidazolonepropionase [Lysinibacillus antri]|uniref:Imidazolonepropionase n=1 Tax=Lysinibacillus antri TaxID=2498145 RepID=A0A432LA64_9BACI|nr:imidazolonepropionase [Lysinibacillus antri]RUL50913.1 imidazolonepropionase [Lysinibacillus antri]